MKIQLKDWKVKEDAFNITDSEIQQEEKKKNSFSLGFGAFLIKEDNNQFGIGFDSTISDDEFILKVEMLFFFETDMLLEENFINSSFAKINAPAIAFPYLRAFISNFTLQSGFDPVMLPSVNFVEFKNKDKEEESFDQSTKDE